MTIKATHSVTAAFVPTYVSATRRPDMRPQLIRHTAACNTPLAAREASI